jgi:Zn-dependent M28 family amino/carboxypeptidase
MAATVAVAAVAAGVVAAGGDEPEQGSPTSVSTALSLDTGADLARAVRLEGLVDHLQELERIAAANDGTRAAGTPGDRASVEYVSQRLAEAGWSVSQEGLSFPYYDERAQPRLSVEGGRIDVETLEYSAGGRVEARTQRAGDGCQASDYSGFVAGRVALVERGGCYLRRIVLTAQRAGAVAAVIYYADRRGKPPSGTLIRPGARIPGVLVRSGAGNALARRLPRVRLTVDAVSERRRTSNVIAELGSGPLVAVAGGHLDSVAEGAGINDNGSGISFLLELAEALGRAERKQFGRVRLAFWAAEEVGLYGSRHHVRRLEASERNSVRGYLNLDMVASGNGGRFVYGGRRGRTQAAARAASRVLRARGRPLKRADLSGASDHAPFVKAGVPVLGIYSGADEVKTRSERGAWGGRASRAFDPCYHRACDRLARIDRRTFSQLADAAAVAFWTLARR